MLLPVLVLVALFAFFVVLDRWVYRAGRNPLIGPLLGALTVSATMAAIFPFLR